MGLHQLQRKSLLSIFVFTVCSLAFSQYALPTTFLPAHEPASRPAPGVSPTPSPSPEWKPKKPSILRRVFHFLKCNEHKQIKEEELSRTGPKLPRSYNTSDFSFPALVQGGWPAVIVYELEVKSSLIIAVEVMNVETFFQKLEGTGSQKEMMFTIPARFGKKPHAALISLKAVTDATSGNIPADFELFALGMGPVALGIGDQTSESAPTNQPKLQTDAMNAFQVKATSFGGQALYGSESALMRPYLMSGPAPRANRLEKVNVTPDMIDIMRGGEFDYSFFSNSKFGRWAAAYHQKTQEFRKGKSISGTLYVDGVSFNELVFSGQNPAPPQTKKWPIRPGGKFRRGEYQILVTASSAVDAASKGGNWAIGLSYPAVKIY